MAVVPVPTELTRPFWEGARNAQIRVPCCRACGTRFFGPEPACIACFSTDLDWVTLPGAGTVYSFSVVHVAPHEGFAVPYVLAVVDLDDGPAIFSHIVDCQTEHVRIGMRVIARFLPLSEDISVPVFVELAASTES